tara:strand:+ start:1914 stop:2234 length:321 start_codon:yes stop_codon:yes gene_type:complete
MTTKTTILNNLILYKEAINLNLNLINQMENELINDIEFDSEIYCEFHDNKNIILQKDHEVYSEPHIEAILDEKCVHKNKIISVKSFYCENSVKWLKLIQDVWIKLD